MIAVSEMEGGRVASASTWPHMFGIATRTCAVTSAVADRKNVARIRHHDPRCNCDQTPTSERRTGTTRLRFALWLAAGLAAAAVVAERAQDQPFPPGSPFALLPGFKIERVTPADKTESLHRHHLRQPRPAGRLAERLRQRQRAAPAARRGRRRHLRVREDCRAQLNTCHGLFFEGRTLYANCRGVMPAIPPPDAAPGGPPQAVAAAAAAIRGRRSASRASTSSRTPTATT